MKSVIQAVAAQVAVDLTEIDVDDDPILQERYGDEVPVLLIDGRKAAKFRIAEATLLRRLKTHQIASWMIKFLPGR